MAQMWLSRVCHVFSLTLSMNCFLTSTPQTATAFLNFLLHHVRVLLVGKGHHPSNSTSSQRHLDLSMTASRSAHLVSRILYKHRSTVDVLR